MLKSFFQEILTIIRSRLFIIGVLFFILFALLFHKLFLLQIVHGEEYLESFTYRIMKETEIKSPRGSIYDADGNVLAYDRLAYTVNIEDSSLLNNNASKNTMIATLLTLIKSTGEAAVNNLPLAFDDEGAVYFSGSDSAVISFKKDIFGINSSDTLSEKQNNMTAQELYDYMRSDKFFNLDDMYSPQETMEIMAVRYELYMKRYMKYISVVVSEDVSNELVAKIKENSSDLPGVTIAEDYVRVYENSKYFAHITGYNGQISQAELDAFEADGHEEYALNDLVGKTGIEKIMEYELSGQKGTQTMYVNSLGSILDITDQTDAVPGGDVYLTIESELQMQTYDILEAKIAGILLEMLSTDVDEDNNEENYISYLRVFHALINNGIIDIGHFDEDDATDLERSVQTRFEAHLSDVLERLGEQLMRSDPQPQADETNEYNKYFNYIYTYLKSNDVLYADRYTAEETVYAQWAAGEISLAEFLKHAISMGWINTEILKISGDYVDTSEFYQSLVDYILEKLKTDQSFRRSMYYYLLEQGAVSGKEVCLLLYQQGVLVEDTDYQELQQGVLDSFSFIYRKITNLQITPDMLALDVCSGAVIVTDVTTGEVKALVTYPSYDANRMSESGYYASLLINESKPLFNRATQQTAAPGSTYKPLAAIASLEEGLIGLYDRIEDLVVFNKVAPSAKCWNSYGHGSVNVAEAIGVSCNFFFYEMGYRASMTEDNTYDDQQGINLIRKYAEMFGLGETTGIEIGEATPQISDESAVRSYIGQGTNNYTPSQICRYTTALANKGTVYSMSLIDKVTDKEGNVLEDYSPDIINQLTDIKDSTWNAVYQGMVQVSKTSSYDDVFDSLNMSVAVKSGTAQEAEDKPDHAWFTGFAPSDDPKYAVTMFVANGYGSTNICDAFRDVIASCFGQPLYNSTDNGRTATFPINHGSDTINYGD